MKKTLAVQILLPCLLGFSAAVQAQSNDPVAPAPVPQSEFDTFEVPQIRVVPITNELEHPWGMAFRNNGDILVTERGKGTLRVIRNGELLEQDIAGIPEVDTGDIRAGLMDIKLHPEDDSIVYLTYSKPLEFEGEQERTVALARGSLKGNELRDVRDIFVAEGVDTGVAASRLLFAPDGKLIMSVGGSYVFAATGEYAQDTSSHFGKLLRLNGDGSAATDNPFVGNASYQPEIYSMGHRNQLGLDFHPETGDLWAVENGPQGGDEANIIQSGQNYGWPEASYSRQYRGAWVTDTPWLERFAAPEVLWWPSIAPSGMLFYTGEHFPEWQGNLLVGSMMVGRIPRTGHIDRIVFNSRGEEIRRESLLTELKHRIRDIRLGPDGHIYVLTDEENGALFRIEPVN